MKIWEWVIEQWERYQAQRRSDALWNKLHRYHVDGKPTKFTQKAAIKAARAAVKNKMKKDREKQQDAKK